MVGIQIGREQEEGEREDDAGFEKTEDFNVTSNAEEKVCGSDYDEHWHVRHDAPARRREERTWCVRGAT